MPARITHNTAQVGRQLRSLRSAVRSNAAPRTLEEYAALVVRRARSRNFGFTDRTGRLRRSIRKTRTRVSGDTVEVAVEADTPYAAAVEYGYRGRFSYLRRAVRETDRELERIADAELERVVRAEGFAP